MANYATLKAAIAAVIKENGNDEITGNLLQQSLLAMVDSLGVGYQYVGIATPVTIPGTPDQNVFYIASTVGTYTNFGGLVLADGEIAILKYNGAWSKESTGAASLEKVNQLGQETRENIPIIPNEVWNDSTGYLKPSTGRSRTDKLLYNENKGINMAAEALFWDENNVYLGHANVNGYCISPYANTHYIAFTWKTIVENFFYSFLEQEKQEINAIKQNSFLFASIVENQTVDDSSGQFINISGTSRTEMLHYIDGADINELSYNACYYAKDGAYLGHTLDTISPYPNTEFIIFCWDGTRKKIASNIIYSTNAKKKELDAVKAVVSPVEILENMVWNDSTGYLMPSTGRSSTRKLPYNKEFIINTEQFECLFFSGNTYQGHSSSSCVSPYQGTTHIAFTWNTIQTFVLYSYLADVYNFKTINGQSILGDGDIVIHSEEQIQSNWAEEDNSSKAFIQNKPDLNQKQDTLQSGINIKTINGVSILGSGNLSLSPTEPTAVKTFYNAADFGFLPTATASENVTALNTALSGGNRTVVVSEVGIYDINDTILIESNTELIFGKGVILRKVAVSGACSFITTIRNKHAINRTTDSNIIIRGLNLDGGNMPIDKSTMDFGSAIYGCTGDVVLYHVDRVILDDIKIYNVPNYGIQLCSFNNVTITNFDLSTGSDGIHVNRGTNLLCKGGVISSHDDAMALNASDWLDSCPEVGDICNVVFEDIIDKSRNNQIGYGTRHLTGAWVDWFSGMSVIKGDKVVSNGHVYRCDGTSSEGSPVAMTSTTQPTFNAEMGEATLDGIHWRYCQDDAVYHANIDNIAYKNIVSHSNRVFCNIEVYLLSTADRSIYPTVEIANYPHCKGVVFDNIDKQGTGIFVRGATGKTDIITNVVLDYTLKNIKCSNGSLFNSLARTHDSNVKITECDFTKCTDTYFVRVGDITTLYIYNCIYNGSIPVKEGGIIKTNCNLINLPTSIIDCKGSICCYENDIYYCNGSTFVKLT